ncbi:hypothetical protein Lal_00040575 [Lupinus albus]|uniref:Uncharacterized protein n=1 Tax=Lupinus albus TaxID=3870 RepID=A0A6A4PIZ8_LUPAL|nr:hypothetical protein Lalb_Chr13g0298681 [Lupinus albus]KAF1887521.1 hypothetical protein Lal_00040575 [Lupinus albus]
MVLHISNAKAFIAVLLTCFFLNSLSQHLHCSSNLIECAKPKSDVDLIEFFLNLEYLEAEFFLFGATGHGLDSFAPELAQGGPSPIGAKMANLDPLTKNVIYQFALQKIGHLRAVKRTVKGFPRPLLNISMEAFAQIMHNSAGELLDPPFNPYANFINYLFASYLIPYLSLTGYMGASPQLQNATSKKLVAGLLGAESGQAGVIQSMVDTRPRVLALPYNITVEEFENLISKQRNELGRKCLKDEGLEAPIFARKVYAYDKYIIPCPTTPKEILRIVYGGGDEHVPGGFFPKGAHGSIAKSYLKTVAWLYIIFLLCKT